MGCAGVMKAGSHTDAYIQGFNDAVARCHIQQPQPLQAQAQSQGQVQNNNPSITINIPPR
jgi:hypothetical protein